MTYSHGTILQDAFIVRAHANTHTSNEERQAAKQLLYAAHSKQDAMFRALDDVARDLSLIGRPTSGLQYFGDAEHNTTCPQILFQSNDVIPTVATSEECRNFASRFVLQLVRSLFHATGKEYIQLRGNAKEIRYLNYEKSERLSFFSYEVSVTIPHRCLPLSLVDKTFCRLIKELNKNAIESHMRRHVNRDC
jgi:hypothetical protein